MINLVPMAGKGSRFQSEGYNLPKPFIPVMGMPMFAASVKSFPYSQSYIFICLSDFLEKYPFQNEIEKHFKNSSIVKVEQVTQGQASTCLLAKDLLDTEESLLISSIDYQVIYDQDHWNELVQDESIDVIIWTFQMKSISVKDPIQFAYCKLKDGNVVEELVEKKTISDQPHLDPAVVGTFYYKKASDFIIGAEEMIDHNIRVNNEFYVGTSINQLIAQGKKVVAFPIDKFISFGDPLDLELYQYWEDFFFNLEDHSYEG
ncbi:sugar phosphate nucleotidyltransferase [bacterium]|nr:sugar phosphate nucleotidyltransferase [bacterium]